MNEFLESEGFLRSSRRKSKKIKKIKDAKKTFHNKLLKIQNQQPKLLEALEKQFQAFQSEMLEKQLQNEAVEKQ